MRRLGEGSWIADGYLRLPWVPGFFVWVQCGDGHVLRYLDRSYTLRVR